ncbi:hypothetical protein GCM10011488_18570 [Steroidobacter agaridevorans]|nr:hypothetical protein GCM10011488_18570 [Steroidobacter agaridevorans]
MCEAAGDLRIDGVDPQSVDISIPSRNPRVEETQRAPLPPLKDRARTNCRTQNHWLRPAWAGSDIDQIRKLWTSLDELRSTQPGGTLKGGREDRRGTREEPHLPRVKRALRQ